MRKLHYLTALFAIGAVSALAQGNDPPARVARLNYMEGPVSFRPDSVEAWAAAAPNYPLTTGDHLWTDPTARLEMHIGSTALRMAPQTALQILNLTDRVAQFSITAGSVNVHIRSLGPDEIFEVDTPNIAISFVQPGDYRVDSDSDSATTSLTVWRGQAQATGSGASIPVAAGQTAHITGMENPTQNLTAAMPPGDFEQWCQGRDRHEDQAQVSARYVPREMVGYEDLDGYGTWVNIPPYGWVWRPNMVPAGWAPYHYGHWAWVEPWGWTWIDDAPWGFAPFHYGRWAFVDGGWVWVPGRMVMGAPPVYAPALVAFVGGPGFGVSLVAGGGVGWFPLGPGEVFVPAYHVSEVYVRQVNIVAVGNPAMIGVVNAHYVNMGVRGAVVVMPQEAFVAARPVARVAVVVPEREIVHAQVVGTTALVVPRQESVLGGGAIRGGPPARFVERTVVVRNAPPPRAVPFAARQQALEANHGRPLDQAQLNSLRGGAPAANPMVREVGSAAGRPAATLRNDRPPEARQQMHPGQPQTESRGERQAENQKKQEKKKAEKKDEKKGQW
jgi:hypothetical protein